MDISEELSKFEVGSKEYVFFEKIFEKLGPNFVRKSVEEKLRESRNNLNKAMKKYFESHILANAVIKSVEQLDAPQEAATIQQPSKGSPSSGVHPLYLNYVQKYIQPEEMPTNLKLFGLTSENIANVSKNKMTEVEYAELKKRVEGNINDFCIKLIQHAGGTAFPGANWQDEFHSTMKNLESKAIFLQSEEVKEKSKKQLREMIKTYYEVLTKGVLLLSKLISLHMQKLEFESEIAELYHQRSQTVFLKTKVLEKKILEATYNKETIPALKKISSQLDQSECKLNEEQNEKSFALEQYLKLGDEYETLVEEYTQLTKKIKEEQWAVDELKKKKGTVQ